MILDFKIYFRYIDDIWAVATKIGTASQFVQTFNTPIESLQLGDYAISKSGVFLDLDTSISGNNIVYKLYQKPSNKYSYILFLSNHKRHIFTNFILQELKRYTLYCSFTEDSDRFINLFHQRLLKRGYDTETFNSALSKLPDRAILLDNLFHPIAKLEPTPTPTFILQSPELSSINWKLITTFPQELTDTLAFQIAYPSNPIRPRIILKHDSNIGKLLLRSLFPIIQPI